MRTRRLLITAGPTQEPIDEVRFIGNRSSGRLGVDLALEAAERGIDVTLLLGPTCLSVVDTRVRVVGFRTTAELQALLATHLPGRDVLVMAAAVADYRPIPPTTSDGQRPQKLRREQRGMTLELEPTPDLLAGCAAARTPGQTLIGFALEPRATMLESARGKLTRKNVDAIVANPLETMDAPTIEAHLVQRGGRIDATDGPIDKRAFAAWLLDRIDALRGAER